MTKEDIQHVISEAIKARENNWTSWLKTIVTFIFIPIITVYASFKVLENRVEHTEKEIEKKVDLTTYDQYIIKQIELQKLYNERSDRIETELKKADEDLKAEIKEIKKFLNSVHKDKKLWYRDFNNELLYDVKDS